MKKLTLLLMTMLFMAMAIPEGVAQEITITLLPGWTWISNPSPDTLDFATALGSFTPMQGDAIKSQWGNANYRNGRWAGSISQFYPGYGYKYYSNRTMPVMVTFNVQQPVPQVVVTTSDPLLVTAISAMGGGEVTSNDGTYILVKGLCWATHENPTTNEDFCQEAESGVGSFSISMTGLNIATTYYVRAYAVTPNGTVYGNQMTFTTRDGIPEVSTAEVTNIMGNRATCGGTVTDNGGLTITARGVCWSTIHNPTISNSHTTNGSGLGSFTSNMTGLNVSTIYYVRAYATTSAGTAYGQEMSFTTRDGIPQVSASVTAVFEDNANCIITLTDNGGFNIFECGVCWSTLPNPTLNNSHISIDDIGGLPVSYTCAMTELSYNTTYYVRAFATNQYTTAYSTEVSFTTAPQVWTNGILPGTFSVSESQQVHFSQGNLQYKASTNTWRLAGSQWTYVGSANNNNSSTYDGWIDLFGWGTSGYNHGAVCYQPWSTSNNPDDYHPYSSWTYNLYDQTGQADWGYNPISNGGNQPNQWRTLTREEWTYVFRTRSTPSGIRYAKATVKGINGVILLPDDWTSSIYALNDTNNDASSFTSNVITSGTWKNIFEPNGAVFLPAAGRRVQSSTGSVGNEGYYWSASKDSSVTTMARCMHFENTYLYSSYGKPRYQGYSVRLVCPAE